MNFTSAAGQTRDFKTIYTLGFIDSANTSYVPPPPVNATPEFIVSLNNSKSLGLDAQNGKPFTYTISFKNVMSVSAADSGLLNVIIGAPSCLAIDEVQANSFITQGIIRDYHVVGTTGETVLFFNPMKLGEVKSLQVNYIQRFAGTCFVRDNFVYQVYGDYELTTKSRMIWTKSTEWFWNNHSFKLNNLKLFLLKLNYFFKSSIKI